MFLKNLQREPLYWLKREKTALPEIFGNFHATAQRQEYSHKTRQNE
jgi:hypothetical protein